MVKTYDARMIIITLGSHIVSGAVDGDFCTIEPHGDGVAKSVGAYGEVVRSIDPDKTLTITLGLQYGAETLKYCGDMYAMDRDTNGGGEFSILITDLKGTTLCSAEIAWVENVPSMAYGKEASDREIVIATGPADYKL